MTAASAGRPPAAPASVGAAGMPRLATRLPEPAHLWIRFAPRAWEGPERPWLDLAAGRLGRNGRPGDLLGGADRPLDDVLYLPPVPARLAGWRDALAERALAGGTPVLVQLLPGDETALRPARGPGEAGAVVVIDLLAALLPGGAWPDRLPAFFSAVSTVAEPGEAAGSPSAAAGGTAEASGAAAGASAVAAGSAAGAAPAAVWPLLPGITDDPELWEPACERLAAAGLRCVQALVPAFGPGDRRRLAEGLREDAFAALFHRQHRQPAVERDFARAAHRHGLAPFLPRPLPAPPLLRADNRRLAGLLALAAELWLQLGRPVEPAQGLFRAARWLDATAYDAGSLSREGNLSVVTALDPLARGLVAAAAAGSEPALLAELMAEYLGP